MPILSVVISAFNEEKKIKDCLESIIDLADEIIFIDNSSTDKTLEIAKKYTSKIYTKENNLMLNVNKNYGFGKATNEWILSLDADERVTPQLATEIREIISKNDTKINGYWIPRKNIIFGKWIQHTGWYPDNQLRLFKKGKGKFPEEHVHEMINVEGQTEHFKEHLLHYNYDTISQFLYKHITIYAPNESEALLKNGYELKWYDAMRFPSQEFLNRFFAKEGYKDGFHGLMLSLLMSFYHLLIFANIWEQQKFRNEDKDYLAGTYTEFNKVKKEITYWFLTSFYRQTKDPVRKLWLRILRKKAKLKI